MVLGSKTGESPYIPRVTEEREILSKIDSADGNLIFQLKDDIVKILEIHKRLANNEGFIFDEYMTDSIMKNNLNIFYDTKNKLFRIKLSSIQFYMSDYKTDQVYLEIFDKYKEVVDVKVSFVKELVSNNLVAFPGEDIICLKDKARRDLYNKLVYNSISDDELLIFILSKMKTMFEKSLCLEINKTNLSKNGEYKRIQKLLKNNRLSLEEISKSPFYVDMISEAVMSQLKRYYFDSKSGFDYIYDDYFWYFSCKNCIELFKDDGIGIVLKSEQIRESLEPMLKEYLLDCGNKFGSEEVVVAFIKIDHLLSKIVEDDNKRFEYLSELISEELSDFQPMDISLDITTFCYHRNSVAKSYKGPHRGLSDKTIKEFNNFAKYLLKYDKEKASIFINLVDILFKRNLYLEYHLIRSSQNLYVDYLNLRKNILGSKKYYFVVNGEVEDKIGFDKIKELNELLKSEKIKLNFLLNNFDYHDESNTEFSDDFIKNLFELIAKNQEEVLVKDETNEILKHKPESIKLKVIDENLAPVKITRLLSEF